MLMQTFNFCMLPLFVFFSGVYLLLPGEILNSRLGRAVILLNASIFYLRAASELLFGDLRNGESRFFLVLALALGVYFTLPILRRRSPELQAHHPTP